MSTISGFGWYTEVLKKYATFSGRARRKEYWMFVLFNVVISFVLGVIEGIIGTGGLLGGLYSLLILLPSIAVAVRRLHDTDRSGWWILVPIVGLIFLFLEGHKNDNRFGPDPKRGF